MKNSLISLFLLLGFVFNVVCLLIFKIRAENSRRDFEREAVRLLNLNINRVVSDLYARCDTFLKTNDFQIVVSSPSSSSSSAGSSAGSSDTVDPLYKNIGNWDYLYYTFNDRPFARVGSRDYSIGDFYPRGGTITDIHPDGVSIDFKYWVTNVRSSLSSSPSLSSSSVLSSKTSKLKETYE